MPKREPADILLERVGRRIAELRRKATLTQEALAEQLQVSVPYVAKVEGGSENLTLRTLHKYSIALGVKVDDLLTEPSSTTVRQGRPRRA